MQGRHYMEPMNGFGGTITPQRRPSEEDDGGFLTDKYNLLWKTVMQPKRSVFNRELLGSRQRRVGTDAVFLREEGSVRNERGEAIEFTFYRFKREGDELFVPDTRCLLYLHSHGGNRFEGFGLLQWAAKLGTNLCLFDFRACGYSEGLYSSLGMLEDRDCQAVADELRVQKGITRFLVWGRSMGAVAGLIFTSKNQHLVDFLVLDSPFSDMETMVRDLGNAMIKFGEYLSTFLFGLVKDEFRKRLQVDPTDFKPIEACKVCETPCIFTVGVHDQLVLPDRVNEMCDEYAGNHKRVFFLDGDHTSPRTEADYAKIVNKIVEHFEKPFYKLGNDREAEANPIRVMGPTRSLKQAQDLGKEGMFQNSSQFQANQMNQRGVPPYADSSRSIKKITLAKELKERELLEKRRQLIGGGLVSGIGTQVSASSEAQIEENWLKKLETRKYEPPLKFELFKKSPPKQSEEVTHWSKLDASTVPNPLGQYYMNPRSQNVFLKPSPIKVSHTSIPMINSSQIETQDSSVNHTAKSRLIFDQSSSKESSYTNSKVAHLQNHSLKRQSLASLLVSPLTHQTVSRPNVSSADKSFKTRFSPGFGSHTNSQSQLAPASSLRQSLNTEDLQGGNRLSGTNTSITYGVQKPIMFDQYISGLQREAKMHPQAWTSNTGEAYQPSGQSVRSWVDSTRGSVQKQPQTSSAGLYESSLNMNSMLQNTSPTLRTYQQNSYITTQQPSNVAIYSSQYGGGIQERSGIHSSASNREGSVEPNGFSSTKFGPHIPSMRVGTPTPNTFQEQTYSGMFQRHPSQTISSQHFSVAGPATFSNSQSRDPPPIQRHIQPSQPYQSPGNFRSSHTSFAGQLLQGPRTTLSNYNVIYQG